MSRRIFVTGDTHGDPLRKLNSKTFPIGKTLGEDDVVFIAGDFGVIWNAVPDAKEKYILKWLDEKPWTTLVVGGNHENWDRLRDLPYEDTKWGRIQRISYRTFFIPNGTVLNINGQSIFCMGGAMSTDKDHRVEGLSWWAGEIPTTQEMNFAVKNLEAIEWNVDTIISHTMPSNNIEMFNSKEGYHFSRIADPTARFLQFIADHIKYVDWYCGHFHKDEEYRDVINGTDVRVVMHDVLEISKEKVI